ncbi:DUF3592 domain-containing protein [Nocardiopsis potens]|uniref:DUF3592 domain-containing protein n=1 Tax=Nocardiopsis potens TaxID=1246458 RepID=UPI00034825EB|nr:DUF3592 domain-containing protein [Nocardiopsis potens]
MTARPKSPKRGNRFVLPMVLGVFTLVLLIIGTVFTVLGSQDYSGHTGRAEAVVTRVDREIDRRPGDDRRKRVDYDVYVGYQVDGTDYSDVRLNGLDADDYGEGDTLTVAYEPGAPDSPVTVQSTEEGALDLFRPLGIGALVLGAAAAAGAIAALVRTLRARG